MTWKIAIVLFVQTSILGTYVENMQVHIAQILPFVE